jgi:hypothetical protein
MCLLHVHIGPSCGVSFPLHPPLRPCGPIIMQSGCSGSGSPTPSIVHLIHPEDNIPNRLQPPPPPPPSPPPPQGRTCLYNNKKNTGTRLMNEELAMKPRLTHAAGLAGQLSVPHGDPSLLRDYNAPPPITSGSSFNHHTQHMGVFLLSERSDANQAHALLLLLLYLIR